MRRYQLLAKTGDGVYLYFVDSWTGLEVCRIKQTLLRLAVLG